MAEQNLDFNIVANTQGMEEIARLINQVGKLETELKSVQRANSAVASSTQTVVQQGVRYNNALDAQSRALRNARQGQQQLGMQINDFATSVSTGASVTQAFNQQIGQVGYAMSMMGGRLGMVGRFLAGPWSIAVIGASMALGYLWEKFSDNTEQATEYSEVLFDTTSSYEAVIRAAEEYNEVMGRENRTRRTLLETQLATTLTNYQEAQSLYQLAAARRASVQRASVTPGGFNDMGLGFLIAGRQASADLDDAAGNALTLHNAMLEINRQLQNLDNVPAGGASRGGGGGRADAFTRQTEAIRESTTAARVLFEQYRLGTISQADFLAGAVAVTEIHRQEEYATRDLTRAALGYAEAVMEATEAHKQLRRTMRASLSEQNTTELANVVLPDSVFAAANDNVRQTRDIMRGYTDDMKDSFDQVGASVSEAFKGMLTGAQGWREGLRGIINAVIDQLWKLYVVQQIVGFVTDSLGSIGLPAPTGVSARAVGGSVNANTPYLVGERGPELFMPRGNGTIIPNHNMGGGGGGSSITLHVDARGAGDPAAVRQQVQMGIAEAAPQLIAMAEASTMRSLGRPRLAGGMR
jgi:hypothetical protein